MHGSFFTLTRCRDFPKAVRLCTSVQTVFYIIFGCTVYKLTGQQYMTSPAFGGLEFSYQIICFSLFYPSVIVGGALYAKCATAFVFRKFLGDDSKHATEHTATGWMVWIGISGELSHVPCHVGA